MTGDAAMEIANPHSPVTATVAPGDRPVVFRPQQGRADRVHVGHGAVLAGQVGLFRGAEPPSTDPPGGEPVDPGFVLPGHDDDLRGNQILPSWWAHKAGWRGPDRFGEDLDSTCRPQP